MAPPPVAVDPLIKTARWSFLLLGTFYGKKWFDYLKPIGAVDKKMDEMEKLTSGDQKRIYKKLSEVDPCRWSSH